MGYMGIDKKENGIIYFYNPITIINSHIAAYHAHFIKITPATGDRDVFGYGRFVYGCGQFVDFKTFQFQVFHM